jgi:hypothetical protein
MYYSLFTEITKSFGSGTLLPAGRKFCKITQNRSQKKIVGREKLAAVRLPFLAKSGRKTGRKKYLMKNIYFF